MLLRPIQILRIVIYYLIFGFLWILLSDFFLNSLKIRPNLAIQIQSLKGIIFVILSGLVISLLLWREGKVKNVLISEIHHRVKNNLAIISAFLELQADVLKNKSNDSTIDPRTALINSVRRIKTIAICNDILYKQENLVTIQTEKLIQNIWEHCKKTQLINPSNSHLSKIKLIKTIHSSIIDIKIGMPLSLILNELFSNSLQHAFPIDSKITKPIVEVEIGLDQNKIFMKYSDNGIGIDDKDIISKESKNELGLFIIKTLTKQIKGEITVDRNRKMEFLFHFPLKKDESYIGRR